MRISNFKKWNSGNFSAMTESTKITTKNSNFGGGKAKFNQRGDNGFTLTIKRSNEHILQANGVIMPGKEEVVNKYFIDEGIYDAAYLSSKVIVYSGVIKGDWRVQKIEGTFIDKNDNTKDLFMIHTSQVDDINTPQPPVAVITSIDEEPEINTTTITTELITKSLPLTKGAGYNKDYEKKDAIKHLQAVINIKTQAGLKIDGGFGPNTIQKVADAVVSQEIADGKMGTHKRSLSDEEKESYTFDLKKLNLVMSNFNSTDGDVAALVKSSGVNNTDNSNRGNQEIVNNTQDTTDSYTFIW